MGKSCRDLAQSLVECVKKSKCMQQQQQSAAAAGAGGAPPPPPPDLRDCMQQEMNEDCKVGRKHMVPICSSQASIPC